jgi:acetyl-CoA synthetase (ADP-forming)
MNIIEKALKEGRTKLSEYETKQVLASYQIPVTKEILVDDVQDLMKATQEIGYPLVLKACSSEIAHKTDKGLIRVDIRDYEEARTALEDIMTNMSGNQNAILVQEMVKGRRELVVGMTRDPHFGPCVVFGLGGIFTEILQDISFRIAPLGKQDALEMMLEIRGHKILDPVRGMQAVDLDMLVHILSNVGRIGLENERVKEIDINPVIIFGSKPVAVDALMVLE